MANSDGSAGSIGLSRSTRTTRRQATKSFNEQLMAKDMPLSLDEQLSAYAAAQDKELLGVETFAE